MALEAMELEIKLAAATDSVWSELFGLALIAEATIEGTVAEKALESHYFDTVSRRLARAGYAYRIRRTPSGFVATLKGFGRMEGGLAHRPEFEAAVPDVVPDLSVFDGAAVGADLPALLAGEALTRLFTVDVVRRQRQLQLTPQTRVEMAVDFGRIVADGQENPLAEVEFELLAGDVGDLLQFVAALCERLPFFIAFKSKFRRGLDLLEGVQELEERPAPVMLTQESDVATACYSLVAGGVGALLQQQRRLGETDASGDEAPVFGDYLRQLRCWLAFFKPLLDPAAYAHWQHLTGQLLAPFDELARVAALEADWEQVSGRLSGSAWLGKQLAARRELLVERIFQTQQSGAYTKALTALWAWAAKGPWREDATCPVREYAAARLEKWLTDWLAMGGGGIIDATLASRLYGQGGKITVAAVCLGPAEPAAAHKAFGRLRSLQKRLKPIWAIETSSPVLQSFLGASATRLLYRDAGLVIGWRMRAADEALRQADRRWKKCAKAVKQWCKHNE